jgi:UPF0176 protein
MEPNVLIAAFYRFHPVDDAPAVRDRLESAALEAGIRGTILVASEGVNGTIAGGSDGVRAVLASIRGLPGFETLDHKEARASEQPFHRLKVRLKNEIVTLGVDGIDPPHQAGTYVDPETWNGLVDDPDVLVIDTRNDYEVRVGTFDNAVNPGTGSFREFPDWAEAELDPASHRKVAMFCTGGIRCEKATALLRNRGFEEVYHLRGGILNYLESMDPAESRWNGECFVFDGRVSVDHHLEPGTFELCHACRRPISAEDRRHPDFEEGVSCPACRDEHTDADRERFRERSRQMRLAERRGESHIGDDARRILEKRRTGS